LLYVFDSTAWYSNRRQQHDHSVSQRTVVRRAGSHKRVQCWGSLESCQVEVGLGTTITTACSTTQPNFTARSQNIRNGMLPDRTANAEFEQWNPMPNSIDTTSSTMSARTPPFELESRLVPKWDNPGKGIRGSGLSGPQSSFSIAEHESSAPGCGNDEFESRQGMTF
jgi:hypothetical protein